MSAPAPKQAMKARRRKAMEPPFLSVDNKVVPIDRERIAALAYSYWDARGGRSGSPEEDWLRAERQLQTGN